MKIHRIKYLCYFMLTFFGIFEVDNHDIKIILFIISMYNWINLFLGGDNSENK